MSTLPRLEPPLKVRWSFPRAIWPARVYPDAILTQTSDPDSLVALEPDAGRELWRERGDFWFARQGQRLIGTRSIMKREREERCDAVSLDMKSGRIEMEMPAVYRPKLFVREAGWFLGARLPNGSSIARVPLDARDRADWETPFPARPTEFAYAAGYVVLVVGDEVVAITADGGKHRWTATLEGVDAPAGLFKWQLQICGDLVLASTDIGTVAFDLASGRRVWFRRVRGALVGYDDRVYAFGYSPRAPYPGHTLWILELKSGKVLLERHVSEFLEKAREGNRFASYPVVSQTHLFITDEIGTLWALDKKSGDPVWSHRPKGILGYISGTRPVLTDGRLYVTSFSMDRTRPPQLYCYEEAAGAQARALDRSLADEVASGLTFRILEATKRQQLTRRPPYHVDGGGWTVYACRMGDASFYIAIRAGKGTATPSSAEGALWVRTAADGDRLLSAFRKALGSRVRAAGGSRPKGPTLLDVLVLGREVGETGSGEGSWVHSKWSGPEGAPEFYVRWSESEGRGEIREKDEAYRRSFVSLFAALVHRGP